ncbi:MAG: thioredoxin family protein [Myxococcales bacterium]|nr:thioredoxin family protein [Myxococcales bacterium]
MTLDLAGIASTADARHDATETIVGGAPSTVVHDQTIRNGEARLAAELGVTDWLATGLIFPVRVFNTSIQYLDPSGQPVQIENPYIHHHDETLIGLGDPWIYGRVARATAGFTLGARLGTTLPLGRTVPDPFALGDQGIAHEHSQFGTGTFTAIAGLEASRQLGPVHVDAALLTIQSVYENRHGYQAGDRYAIAAGAASALGTKLFRFRATAEAVWETAESWSGVVHTDDGNIGRTDVLAGVSATWIATEDWHLGLELKVPVYTHVKGGQLDALGFIGLSVGTHFHAFGEEEGEGDHHHHHDDDHDPDDVAMPTDWTNLDKVDVSTDGSAPPLTPVLGKVTVFDFWATWCKPCKVVDHELAALARRFPTELAVRKLDVVDDDSPASQTYVKEAKLPHVKVFGRDGKLLWERSAPPLVLIAEIEKLLQPAQPRAAP